MRFGVSYLRIDSCATQIDCPNYVIKNWETFPQVVSICTFILGLAGLVWMARRKPQDAPAPAPPSSQRPASSPRHGSSRLES